MHTGCRERNYVAQKLLGLVQINRFHELRNIIRCATFIVQKAVTDNILVPIYETEFLGFSYGFRPGRGAHNALDALTVGIEQRKVNWILDLDIRGFFDNVSRDWMVQFLEHRIADKRLIRLITKWLNAGVMDGDDWSDTGRGTPQGAIASPVLWKRFHNRGYGNLMIMET